MPKQNKKPQPQPQPQQEKLHQNLIVRRAFENGWKVKLTLYEGVEISGMLKGYDNFTLVVLTEDNRLLVVFKHSLKYMEVVL